MKTNYECTNDEVVIRFRKFRFSVPLISGIILIILAIILLLIEITWYSVLILCLIPFMIYFHTNLIKNFRTNDCPVKPLIINKKGISYVTNTGNFLGREEDVSTFIKWEEITDISYKRYTGDWPFATFVVYKIIEIQLLPTSKYENDKILIEVSYANFNAKKIVKIMQRYLHKDMEN